MTSQVVGILLLAFSGLGPNTAPNQKYPDEERRLLVRGWTHAFDPSGGRLGGAHALDSRGEQNPSDRLSTSHNSSLEDKEQVTVSCGMIPQQQYILKGFSTMTTVECLGLEPTLSS